MTSDAAATPSAPVVLALGSSRPRAAADAWLAPGSVVVGDVTLHEQVSVWFGAVLRGDEDAVEVGARSNVQDGAVLHTDPGLVLRVGRDVSVGHAAVLHGCTVGDGCLVGMGARVLNGATVGAGSLVAAGSVVLEGTDVPARSLVAGVPARVVRELTDDEVERLRHNATVYVQRAQRYREDMRASTLD